jgi:general nucleoside transport system permease protein
VIEFVLVTIVRAMAVATPLLWASLGETFAERSGVVNLGIEGMMIVGAFVAFVVAHTTGQPYLGLAAAAAGGTLAAALHGFVSITLRANQYVAGLALAMLGLGITGVLGRGWEGIPLEASLPEISLITYLGVAVAACSWFVFYHTGPGIAIRSVGESPGAAAALGVNVGRVRYQCVLLGGLLAGVAGGFLSVAYRPSWTEGMSGGLGWIALAITIFAGWDPLRVIGGALFFGALFHLSFRLQDFLAPELLRMMPFASTIIVLALTAGRRRGQGVPEALGVPYSPGDE